MISILLSYVLNCSGQYRKLGAFKYEISKVLFSINDEEKMKTRKGLYFPEFMTEDSVLFKGYRILKKQKPSNKAFPANGKNYYWNTTFEEPLTLYLDSTLIYQRIFAKNVTRYEIYFRLSEDGNWYKKDYQLTFEKYQIPKTETLEEWLSNCSNVTDSTSNDPVYVLKNRHKSISICQMAIVVYSQFSFHKTDFILGDFKILNYKKAFTTNVYHPFLLKYNDRKFKLNNEIESQIKCVLFNSLSHNLFPANTFKITFEGVDTISDQLNKQSVIRLFDLVFDQYQFYKEYSVKKNEIKTKFEQLLQVSDTLKTTDLLDKFQQIIEEFKDPHFKLIAPKKLTNSRLNKSNEELEKNISRGPVRLYDLYGHIYIAAVLDTISVKNLIPGMEVTEIDYIPIHFLIDSLANNYSGNIFTRREKALSASLIRNSNQTCILKAIKESDTITEKLVYNKEYSLPSNFNNHKFCFRQIDNTTAYLRIPSWDLINYIQFLNYKEDFKTIKNLIIDLRDNPGGWEIETIRFASMFVNKPSIYCHNSYPWSENKTIKATTIVTPAINILNMSFVNVIILINGRTACASEAFCEFMREMAGAVIIGSEKSSGVLAHGINISLPYNYILTSSLSVLIETAAKRVVEHTGIEPDIWIPVASIEDLAPYKDAILSAALALFTKGNAYDYKVYQLSKKTDRLNNNY